MPGSTPPQTLIAPRPAPVAWRPAWLLVAAAAALPFAVGRLAGGLLIGDEPGGGPVLCPFRAATGVPCPLCGATRSVVLFARGDAGFLHYNPVWVAVLLALVALGLVAAAAGLARPRPRPAAVRALVLACLVAGSACSLLHHQAITA